MVLPSGFVRLSFGKKSASPRHRPRVFGHSSSHAHSTRHARRRPWGLLCRVLSIVLVSNRETRGPAD